MRAGLTQAQLSELTGTQRSVIARWEQGAVSPSIDNMLEIIEACGFELPLVLVPREDALDERLAKNRQLSPERRAHRLLGQLDKAGGPVPERRPRFDPYGLLETLDRHRVIYVVIGGFARVIQGIEEITRGLDIVPSTREQNLELLATALDEVGASRADRKKLNLEQALAGEEVVELKTDRGELKVVAEPAGTGGYDDLRRAATREPLGRGSVPRSPRPATWPGCWPRTRAASVSRSYAAAQTGRARAAARDRALTALAVCGRGFHRIQPVGAT